MKDISRREFTIMAAAALPLLPANALATEKRTYRYGQSEGLPADAGSIILRNVIPDTA